MLGEWPDQHKKNELEWFRWPRIVVEVPSFSNTEAQRGPERPGEAQAPADTDAEPATAEPDAEPATSELNAELATAEPDAELATAEPRMINGIEFSMCSRVCVLCGLPWVNFLCLRMSADVRRMCHLQIYL